jgi:hypothetical protein
MKIVSALTFIATLLVSTVALSDPPMKDVQCTKIQHSGFQFIEPGHSNFLTPVLFKSGRTKIIVNGSSTVTSDPQHLQFADANIHVYPRPGTSNKQSLSLRGPGSMGCFAVNIAPTATDNFGTGGNAVAGEFNIDHCSFTVNVDKDTVLALMVENDDNLPHEYDVISVRTDRACK